MKKETKNKVIVLAAVAAIATYGFASPLSLPIKAVILGAEKGGT